MLHTKLPPRTTTACNNMCVNVSVHNCGTPYSREQFPVASTRVEGWGDEPCEPTVRLHDWSELVASYSRMKSAWGWANGRQPIFDCYIRKYVIILGGYSCWRPPTKILGGCVPIIPGGVDASDNSDNLSSSLSEDTHRCRNCLLDRPSNTTLRFVFVYLSVFLYFCKLVRKC